MIDYEAQQLEVERLSIDELHALDHFRRGRHMNAIIAERMRIAKIMDHVQDVMFEAKSAILDGDDAAKKTLLDAKRVEAKIKNRVASLKHAGSMFQTLTRTP